MSPITPYQRRVMWAIKLSNESFTTGKGLHLQQKIFYFYINYYFYFYKYKKIISEKNSYNQLIEKNFILIMKEKNSKNGEG